jgi:hypothetical protein
MYDETNAALPPYEIIEVDGVRYAEVIRPSAAFGVTTFISAPESSFQFGLLEQPAGYEEKAHFHPEMDRQIRDLQELIVVQKGVLVVSLFSMKGELIREIELGPGHAIVLVAGVHAYQTREDMKALILKQGPFVGNGSDKVYLGQT